jgi:hypothetical protein
VPTQLSSVSDYVSIFVLKTALFQHINTVCPSQSAGSGVNTVLILNRRGGQGTKPIGFKRRALFYVDFNEKLEVVALLKVCKKSFLLPGANNQVCPQSRRDNRLINIILG